MQHTLFDSPAPASSPEIPAAKNLVPAVPVKAMKAYNPQAKKFYWDGERFGVMSMGSILWFVYHQGKRYSGWVANSRAAQPETYTEHLFKDARSFQG